MGVLRVLENGHGAGNGVSVLGGTRARHRPRAVRALEEARLGSPPDRSAVAVGGLAFGNERESGGVRSAVPCTISRSRLPEPLCVRVTSTR